MAGSADLRYIDEVLVKDGEGEKPVKPGDKVSLIPPELRGLRENSHAMDMARESYKSHKRWLKSEGPYEIDQIGLWPCGRVMLYLKPTGGGYYASDFMAASG